MPSTSVQNKMEETFLFLCNFVKFNSYLNAHAF